MRGDTKAPGRGQIVKHGVTTLAWLALVALGWLPWLAWLLSQANRVATGFWVPDYGLGGYLLGLFEVTLGAGCPDLLHVHAMLAAVGLLALALWYAWRDPGRGLVPLVLVLVPTGSLVIVSEIWRPVYVARALLPSLPFLSILAAAALARLRSEYRRVILAALVPVLVLAGVWQAKSGMGGARLAGDVAAHYHDGDVIYHANLASYILLSYYLPAQEYRQAVWPDAGNLSQALTVETQQAMGIPRQAAGQIDARRLLVLWIENPMTTAAEVAELEAALALGEATRLTRWEADTAGLATVALWEVSLSPVREGESPGAQ